jgi:hypothetical protein
MSNETLTTEWLTFRKDVDKKVSKICGLGIRCLSDVDFYGFFPEGQVGMSEYAACVEEAAYWVLDENHFPYEGSDHE